MRALTSVLESDEVGQAQVCRAPLEERLASSRAQTAASVLTKQNAFTRQRGQPSSVQCYNFLFNVSVLHFFFNNFVMSSSVVSVEDHQQIVLNTWSSSAVFLSLSWLLLPLPSRRTVSWDSALVPALAGRGGEAAWTAAQLPCRSHSPQQMHFSYGCCCSSVIETLSSQHQDPVCSSKYREVFILFFLSRNGPPLFYLFYFLERSQRSFIFGWFWDIELKIQEEVVGARKRLSSSKKKKTPASYGVFAVWCSAANQSPKLR